VVSSFHANQSFGEEVVECELQSMMVPVGYHNSTIFIAGQAGELSWNSPSSLRVVCSRNYWGRNQETCLKCPSIGATCDGYVEISPRVPVTATTPDWATVESVFDIGSQAYQPVVTGYHTYPRPTAGFYSLNGTEASACPDVTRAQYPGRDVCIVKCEPEDACTGDNYCGNGYVSKEPMFRCASCAPKFFRRNGECIPCPSSPYAVFIAFGLIIMCAGGLGWILNRKNVNIAVLSIGIDYFQVLAIFGAARIRWPSVIKELFYLLSAFNLNIEIVAPECLVPDVSFKQKFYAIFLLPLGVLSMFSLASVVISLCKCVCLCRFKDKTVWTSHASPLIGASLTLFYFMYIYLTRTLLDVFNCTPTSPPDGKLYLQVIFEECGIPGGTQLALLPWAICGFLLYTAGYPIGIGLWFYRNREIIMEDQLLRAIGIGDDKLSNPRALEFRRKFHRSYYQFRPDYAYFWVLFIVFRKFCIAATAILFNKNAAFQMAACLLVMFLAYSLQVKWSPYMSPSDGDLVIKQHDADVFTSAVHRKLDEYIKEVKARGRKRTRKNLLTYDGKLNRNALLGVLTGWLFNYNTIESVMLFCGVIVSLMGIMYVAQDNAAVYLKDAQAQDSITAVVMFTIMGSVIYFFMVVITEIVILWNEATAKEKALKAAQRTRIADKAKGNGSSGGSSKNLNGAKGPSTYVLGPVDQHVNPLFLKPVQSAASGDTPDTAIEAIMTTSYPPPRQLWELFQDTYGKMSEQMKEMNLQLADAKMQLARSTGEESAITMPATINKRSTKAAFAPTLSAEDDLVQSSMTRANKMGSGVGNTSSPMAGAMAGNRATRPSLMSMKSMTTKSPSTQRNKVAVESPNSVKGSESEGAALIKSSPHEHSKPAGASQPIQWRW
jgi:hypothetical protein